MLHITTVNGISTSFPTSVTVVLWLWGCFWFVSLFYNMYFGVFLPLVKWVKFMVKFQVFTLWANIGDKELMERVEDVVFSVNGKRDREGRTSYRESKTRSAER